MYSIWSSTNQEQDLLATFQLGKGQTYLYPVHVPPSGTAMIDVKEIAQMGTPDVNGSTLPVSVTQGRLSISAASGKPIDPINVVISGGIYNPTKATCGYTCETCDGCSNFDISPDPFDGTDSVLAQLYAQCTWTDGTLYDYTNVATWSSTDTSIVTVETSGDSQPELADPVDVGSAYLEAALPSEPVSMGQICASPPLPNCQYTQAQPQTPATVTVACPTTVSLAGTAQAINWNPQSSCTASTSTQCPTGLGSDVEMVVGPGSQNFKGAKLTENISPASSGTTCPSSVLTALNSSGNNCNADPNGFTVGSGGTDPAGTTLNVTTGNQFWDIHGLFAGIDVLGATGAGSCNVVCSQSYSCGGTQLTGNFTITYGLSHTTVNGIAVTKVTATKTAQ